MRITGHACVLGDVEGLSDGNPVEEGDSSSAEEEVSKEGQDPISRKRKRSVS